MNKSFISLFLMLAMHISSVFAEPELNRIAAKASERLLMDIQQVGESKLIAVGERGHILISENKGESWRQVQVPTEALLTRVNFIDEMNGWAIGHQQVILKTDDAGESWVVQYQNDNLDQPALFDIWFRDSQNGIAIGAYGLYLKTEDGGKSWEEIYQEKLEDLEIGFPHFYSLSFDQKSKQLFMAGELGLLAVSKDAGETWKKLESPYAGSFFNVRALPNGYIIALGLRGHLFRSTDQGKSWQEIQTNTISGLQRSILMPNGKLFIVGTNGTQLISDDYAKSVKLIQRSDRVHLASAIALPNLDVLLVGVNGVLKAEIN